MTPVDLLQVLVRARTVNPPGSEADAAAVLEAYLTGAGVRTEVFVSPGGRTSLVARIDGPHDRPSLVLLSHSDVVPVEEDGWTHDPFGAEVADGFLWGRGALDMKGIAVMHAVAMAELARSDLVPLREVIMVMAADEESGGGEGADWLVNEHPRAVGFEEGHPPPEVIGEGAFGVSGMLDRAAMLIALGEKTGVWIDVVAKGPPGHGALPPEQQASVQLANLIGEIAGFGTPRVHPVMRELFSILATADSGFRAAIFRALASPAGRVVARTIAPKLRKAGALGLLLSDSLTPTQVAAGYKSNVIPADARASFDCRLLPDTDVDEFVLSVNKRARLRGGFVENVQLKGRGPVSSKGPLFTILEQISREAFGDAVTAVSLSPGITDLRFFRALGATGYGWCPLILTPELLATIHGHDERVGVDDFELAVKATCDVVLRAST